MTQRSLRGYVVVGSLLWATAGSVSAGGQGPPGGPGRPPGVGEPARDFALTRLDGRTVTLSALRESGPVVVIMLRGWVGYQ